MIIGIGCDIIEIARVAKALEREAFKRRVFTVAEADYCESRGLQAPASFAARFAAKEALLKALGTGLRGGRLTEIEVTADSLGRPGIKLSGHHAALARRLGAERICLSLSHGREQALAYVVIEGAAGSKAVGKDVEKC